MKQVRLNIMYRSLWKIKLWTIINNNKRFLWILTDCLNSHQGNVTSMYIIFMVTFQWKSLICLWDKPLKIRMLIIQWEMGTWTRPCVSAVSQPPRNVSMCQYIVLSKHRTEALIHEQWQSILTISLQWPEAKLSLIYPFKHNADMPST